MLEDVPVHGSKLGTGRTPVYRKLTGHQRNLSLDFRQVKMAPCGIAGHQRNRSLDSVLQRIPEDMTPVSPDAPPPLPAAALAGSDDSGISCAHAIIRPPPPFASHAPVAPLDHGECDDHEQRRDHEEHEALDRHDDRIEHEQRRGEALVTESQAGAARSRESLDSGNPEDDVAGAEDEPPAPEPTRSASECERSTRVPEPVVSPRNKDCLLRLFECELVFDMNMAISYLFNSKEPGVQSYLANKLFSFPPAEVDFYLPQLATMYAEMGDVAEVLRPYLVQRCRQSADFSVRLAWLLAAFGGDAGANGRRRSRAARLREEILAEKMRPAVRRGHQRSQSDASALRAPAAGRHLGDLASGRAFDSGCACGEPCHCGAPRLEPQLRFVGALTAIGRLLVGVTDREQRSARLRAELAALDLNLPARVWLPLYERVHYVLRIPPHAAAVLNSKDKAPYLMYVEVLDVHAAPHTPLPGRLLPPAPAPISPHSPPIRQTKSEENLVPDWPYFAIYSPCDDPEMEGCWSQEEEETRSYVRRAAPDSLSQLSGESSSSRESVLVAAGEVRRRLADATAPPPANAFRHDPADPSAQALKESWACKEARVRAASPYGHLPGWRLLGCIVKCGDDLRQELLASQLLRQLQAVWERERVPLKLQPYTIVCLDSDTGLIEPVLNTVSIHQIKRHSGRTLRAWLELEHGPPTSEGFLKAQRNFVQSTAAYAIISYLLQLKDRHNGNILLDNDGHLIHIDFGFILSISPKNLGFETSPFKLTPEFVEVMDGESSDMFQYFKVLMLQGFVAARKHMEKVLHVVEIMRTGNQLACLRSSAAVTGLRSRFHFGRTDAQLAALVDRLVHDALQSISTRLYDGFQYYTNGIQ